MTQPDPPHIPEMLVELTVVPSEGEPTTFPIGSIVVKNREEFASIPQKAFRRAVAGFLRVFADEIEAGFSLDEERAGRPVRPGFQPGPPGDDDDDEG